MPQPVRALTDAGGVVWLVLDNGHRIPLGTITTDGGGNGAPGVTDHGALTGLEDDDHSHYVLDAGDTMTGRLINRAPADDLNGAYQIELHRDIGPGIALVKDLAPANYKAWRMYVSGVADASGPNDSSLTFTPTPDNLDASGGPYIRMYRDGRMSIPGLMHQGDAGTLQLINGWTPYGGTTAIHGTKHAGMVTWEINLGRNASSGISAGSEFVLGQIPADVRPGKQTGAVAIGLFSGGLYWNCFGYAKPNGDLCGVNSTGATRPVAAGDWLGMTLTYRIA